MALYRRTTPTACFLATYEPSLTVFVQGRKRVNLNGILYLCDESSFLLSSIDVPAESQIIEASEQVPMLSMFLRLDMPTVREVLSREDLPEPATHVKPRGIAVGETTVGLLDACTRLIDLLDTPEDIPFLGHLIQREILYRILRTPQGERLRAIATTGDLSHRTARAIAKCVAWRMLMRSDGMDATSAAYEVGYESVSQFNREYSRFFGQPPMRDIKTLRDNKVVSINAA